MIEYVGSIERETLENTYFRRVLFTGRHSQLVLMCLQPGETIGDEVHPHVDQFLAQGHPSAEREWLRSPAAKAKREV